jgi:hypothetical protein
MSQSGTTDFFDFGNESYTIVVVANAKTDNDIDFFLTQDGVTLDRTWWRHGGGRQTLCAVSGSAKVCSDSWTEDTTFMSAWRYDAVGSVLESFNNGNITPYNTWTSISGDTVEDGTMYLGTDNAASNFDDKQIMEICIFKSDMSDADLDDLMDALNTKWAVF